MMISPQDNEALYYLIFRDEQPEDLPQNNEPDGSGDE